MGPSSTPMPAATPAPGTGTSAADAGATHATLPGGTTGGGAVAVDGHGGPAGEAPPPGLARTLGELRASGWRPCRVADELRRNAARRIAGGEPIVPGVVGFTDTVVPQLENAILAGHDMILLGERGQAKTRILRALVTLLDEWLPVVEGSEINDDPYHPTSRYARLRVGEEGDDTPVAWVHRQDRYGEKLATPDTSIADLIGEVDPIKVAEGRYLSDELTLHYGLVPRVNRGIFAVNELPDLAERIQVGLLNVLEERDVQIRGHRVRLPLDVVLVATANPEDYTNRGRIITPLKDRFGAQIRTHYPRDVATEVAVVRAEAELPDDGVPVSLPGYLEEVVAEVSQLARRSPHLNQRSGVSVRLSIANYETLVANARRRALRTGEPEAVPRVSDLAALVASTQGKVELEALEEGREAEVVAQLVGAAVLTVFRRRVVLSDVSAIVAEFGDGRVVHAGDDLASAEYLAQLRDLPALEPPARALAGPDAAESPASLAAAVEFVLEGLHLTKRLNKDASGPRALYRSRK
jgi:magnesium chelatase subunit I